MRSAALGILVVPVLIALVAPGGALVRDLPPASTTRLVSAAADGGSPDQYSSEPSISADGRWVAFVSSASDIVPDSSGIQIYLRDTVADTTQLISHVDGVPGNDDSVSPSISADGSAIAYVSTSTNLVAAARSGIPQILIWSRASNSSQLASVSNDVVPVSGNGMSDDPVLSGDGRSVAFTSSAGNLTSVPSSGAVQVYLRDLVGASTTMVSVNPFTGAGAMSGGSSPSISQDATTVAFATVDRLTDSSTHGVSQIYLWSRNGSSTAIRLGSLTSAGSVLQAAALEPSLSADGRFLAFSSATDANGQRVEFSQVLLRDTASKTLSVVSHDVAGAYPANADTRSPSISADGSSLAFISAATNLIAQIAPSGRFQVYSTGLSGAGARTRAVTRAAAGAGLANADAFHPVISSDGTFIAFDSNASNLVPQTLGSTQVLVRNITEVPDVVRVGGADRFEVSAAASAQAFGTGVPVVYIASGAVFADALSGSAAAGARRGPVLLVTRDALPNAVIIELQRLKPGRLVILGGPNSVSESVESVLAAFAPVSRIGGADRYEVSAALSAQTFALAEEGSNPHPTAYVASGAVFPDALSGSAAAGRLGGPVLLVTKDSIPAPVLTELKRLQPHDIVLLGGENTVSRAVLGQLSAISPTARVGGADRFAVSAEISQRAFPARSHTAYVASGAVFPDALSGAAAAIQHDGPVLLVTAGSIPAAVADELDRLEPVRIIVLGGTQTVSDEVLAQLRAHLR
jgi:putative cell wall-binding protein/Tol biopolymer transport system component